MYCFVLVRLTVEEKCNGRQIPTDRPGIMRKRPSLGYRRRGERWGVLNIEHVDVCLNHWCILFVLLHLKRLDGTGPIEGPVGSYALFA